MQQLRNCYDKKCWENYITIPFHNFILTINKKNLPEAFIRKIYSKTVIINKLLGNIRSCKKTLTIFLCHIGIYIVFCL
jgi:hypothetical protein